MNTMIETKNEVVLSGEQKALLDIMENSNQHMFVTGRAGAGKSVLLREFRATTKKRVVVAAPTGIAALNVRGQTLHSLFKLAPELYQPGKLSFDKRLNTLLRRIDALIIDEISMVRADLIDAVEERLRVAKGNDIPFGGVQLIMFGDVFQLPPVVGDDDLVKYFEKVYGGHFFFNALIWKQTEFKVYELTQVFRQKDPVFKSVLNAVRDGSVNDEQIAQLNMRHGVAVPAEGTVILAPTNSLVTNINQQKLDNLAGAERLYKATIIENGKKMSRNVYPTEELLTLKEGAQIVMLKNDKDGRWVNGTVGKIERLADDAIEVNISGIVYPLEKETWEETRYAYDPETDKVESEVVSSFTQYPVRLAWALTIHKSQGQTYESVALDLTTAAFAAGQIYVALSRATSLEGLYLKLPVRRRDIIVDPKVSAFMARRETITVETPETVAQEIVEEAIATAQELVELGESPAGAAAIVREAEQIAEHLIDGRMALPTRSGKGGRGVRGSRADWQKCNFKLAPETVGKLNQLAEENADLDKGALIDRALREMFTKYGL